MQNFSKIVFFLLFSTTVFAQGVCDIKTGVEKGGFTFDGPSAVCIGQSIKLKDNSGGTGVRYIFGYLGDDASKLSSISSTTTPEWTFLAPGQYTVLQYGKKGGKDMYYCDVVRVRENTQPKVSYSTCNNDLIEISIPIDPKVNDFDYYKINWGDGNPPETIDKMVLPYNKSKQLSLPRTIKIEGFFNSGNTGCPSPNAITLSALVPSSFPTGYEQPFYPNIEKIELIDAKSAQLEVKGSFQDNGYDLFMTQQGKAYSNNPILKNVKPGSINIDIPDSTKSYCFYLQRAIACGTEQSAEICTVVLSDVDAQNKQNTILWQEYPNAMTGIPNATSYGRYLNRDQFLQKKENGILLPSININGKNGSLTETVDCLNKYCYRIITETQGQIYYNAFKGKSVSKEICVDRKDVFPDAITTASVTVNNMNYSEIKFKDNSPWILNRTKYILYKEDGTAFIKIDSSTTIQQFLDQSVDASQKSYCYKIGFVDECESNSQLSPSFCTVNLSEAATGTTLQWTSLTPFGNSQIGSFEVQSFNEQTNMPSVETIKMASETSYQPVLDNFEEEAQYRIRIVSIDGQESFSNTYTIPIAVKLFLPDAFSPNDDSINDILEIKGSTKRIANFELQIYNRWGNPVYISTDPSESWDGKYQNDIAPSDIYTYKIYAKLKDGYEFNKSGKILLLK